MGRNLPKLGKQPSAQESANQGTDPQGFDVSGAGTVSYITSFLPGDTQPETMTEAQLNKMLIDMTPQERIAYATKLKQAGYRVGPINGAVTKNLRNSWLSAHSDLQAEIQAGQALDLDTFLQANANAGGTGKSGVNIASSQINDTSAAALVQSIYKELAGQAATEEDIARHTKALRAAQKANPVKTVYDSTGNSSTSGGIDTRQFLTEELQGTELVKEQRTRDALTLAAQELGGLR